MNRTATNSKLTIPTSTLADLSWALEPSKPGVYLFYGFLDGNVLGLPRAETITVVDVPACHGINNTTVPPHRRMTNWCGREQYASAVGLWHAILEEPKKLLATVIEIRAEEAKTESDRLAKAVVQLRS